jgi:transcriptional regulator with XRE-family HTH domain
MDINVPYFDPRLYSVGDVCRLVGARAKELRIARSLSQAEVAKAVGVLRTTIIRFERTGRVGFDVVVGIAIALGAEAELASLFAQPRTPSIDEIVSSQKPRRRVRARR